MTFDTSRQRRVPVFWALIQELGLERKHLTNKLRAAMTVT